MLAKRLQQVGRFFSSQRLEAPKKYSQTFSCHRNIMNLYDYQVFNEDAIFVAPNATIIGEVFMGKQIAIWHGTVIRGDINRIFLVKNISIGNNCVLHTAASSPTGLTAQLVMRGHNVVQNNCTLYSCTLERGAYIGHNSVIMEGAVIQAGAIVAPNSVVPPGRVVKERQVWGGNPIKYIRKAMEQESFVTFEYARHANNFGKLYTETFLPYNNAYLYNHGAPQPLEKTVSLDRFRIYEGDTNYDPSESTFNRYL